MHVTAPALLAMYYRYSLSQRSSDRIHMLFMQLDTSAEGTNTVAPWNALGPTSISVRTPVRIRRLAYSRFSSTKTPAPSTTMQVGGRPERTRARAETAPFGIWSEPAGVPSNALQQKQLDLALQMQRPRWSGTIQAEGVRSSNIGSYNNAAALVLAARDTEGINVVFQLP
jgi:hypothetical protein